MKRKLLFGCMTALAAMLVISCSSDLAIEGGSSYEANGEEVEVTFSVSAESAQATTRSDDNGGETTDGTNPDNAVGGPGRWQNYIGKGQEVDILIYAVYEEVKDANGGVTYNLLEQYGQGYSTYNNTTSASYPSNLGELNAHKGQTIYNVGDIFKKGGSVEITLRLMRNRTYHVAFWAQSSETNAYDTHDLTEVKVDYGTDNDNPLNNDESRDAFCKVEILSITTGSSTRYIKLTRPFAQINVGTTGADYKRVIEKGRTTTQSKIEISGVAQYFNVVEDKVIVDESHPLTKVTFDFSNIPAYVNMEIPEKAPETEYEKDEEGFVTFENEDQEFLKINLDQTKDEPLKGYKITYPTIKKENNQIIFLTETFKYLSMCYVLVPSHKTEIPNYDEESQNGGTATDDPYTSSTLENVTIWFKGKSANTGEMIPWSLKGLKNVPVHRNWRTNILFGLHDKNPDDPNEDDDPTSILKATSCSVTTDSYFNGEYNTTDEGVTWDQDAYGDNLPPTEKE